MLLFFIMAMVAAYANRTLIFEQKISANVYRFTKAAESAEAGAEWAIAMLNGGRIDANCQPSTNANDTTFRQRYLQLNADTGTYSVTSWKNGAVSVPVSSVCYKSAPGAMTCQCPDTGNAVFQNPPADLPSAFAASLRTLASGRPGVIALSVAGCSSLGSACYAGTNQPADAAATANQYLGLLSGLSSPPIAALTVTGNVSASAGQLAVTNTEPASGITVHAGGNIAAAGSKFSPPAGTGGDGSLANDAKLTDMATAQKVFLGMFGMDPATYRYQPGAYRLQCTGADCTPVSLQTAIANNPGRVILVTGDLTINNDTPVLGTAGQPLLLVVDGAVTLAGSDMLINGMIYSKNFVWAATASNSVIDGALVVEGDFRSDTDANIVYASAPLNLMSRGYGSFVRVPGSWIDK
jgi:hypothetical protein